MYDVITVSAMPCDESFGLYIFPKLPIISTSSLSYAMYKHLKEISFVANIDTRLIRCLSYYFASDLKFLYCEDASMFQVGHYSGRIGTD